jgi:hypothetical protein
MDIEFSLLENGFDFLHDAINNINIAREDEPDDEVKKRLLKYAILHLASGIELVMKHRLLLENWTYIFFDMNKANKHAFEEGDFKSVDSASSVERLKNLCDINLTKDEEMILENLRKKRNKIEHFKIKESVESVETIMYSSLSFILKFIAAYTTLTTMNDNESCLFDIIKKATLNLEEVIDGREKVIEISAKNDGVYDKLFTCPVCLKSYYLCGDGDEGHCLFCYYTDDPKKVAEEYLSNVLGISAYLCGKYGDEYPLYDCFECEETSMIIDSEKELVMCLNCGYTTSISNIERCTSCGKLIYIRDERKSICDNCFNYYISKDD